MKKTFYKKLFNTLIMFSVFLGSNISLAASGPNYISFDDFCDVYEIYITPQNNIYGREIGCERKSVIVFGQYNGERRNPRIHLNYYADGVGYIDNINLRSGLSSLYYTDGSLMDFIVESDFKIRDNMPN